MSDRKATLPPVPVPRVRPRRRRWRWLLSLIMVVGVLFIAYIATMGYTLWSVSTQVYVGTLVPLPPRTETAVVPTPAPELPTPLPGAPTWTAVPESSPTPVEALPPGRINILVLGTDKGTVREETSARSDTLIIVSVDPQWKTAGIMSVPRDLQVPVPGHGLQKINAAYFYGEFDNLPGGGPTLAVPTVSKYFNVPIQYYVTVNFDGFEKIIDEVGGVDIFVPEAIDDPEYPGPYNSFIHVHFEAGCQHMDGARALEYARTRHQDSDFGRALRQQAVIKAVREKVLQAGMLLHYADLLHELGNSIETNIPPEQQLQFVQLAGQIRASDIYTAQIDSTMVRELPVSGNLDLRWDKARPLLNWFFGRGVYANLRPGTVLTPTPVVAGADGPISTGVPAALTPSLGQLTGPAGLEVPATDTPAAASGSVAQAAPLSDKCPQDGGAH